MGKAVPTLEELQEWECPTYQKTGSCHRFGMGVLCFFRHTKPLSSPTLLLSDIYQRPRGVDDPNIIRTHFEDFYEDLYAKLSRYGEIKHLCVCDYVPYNTQMAGHALVQYRTTNQASAALRDLHGSFFKGIPVIVEFSPVKHLRRALCPAYEDTDSCLDGIHYCMRLHRKKTQHDRTPSAIRRRERLRRKKDAYFASVLAAAVADHAAADHGPFQQAVQSDQDSCITQS